LAVLPIKKAVRERIFLRGFLSFVLTALADPVKVVQIAADIIPEPTATSVQHDAVLLAVVVVGLVLAPGWPLHDLACNAVHLFYLDAYTYASGFIIVITISREVVAGLAA